MKNWLYKLIGKEQKPIRKKVQVDMKFETTTFKLDPRQMVNQDSAEQTVKNQESESETSQEKV